ncbi:MULTISPECIES: CBS domain-containing protein [unclassified Spirosoma]|uniref:CBS domain-containing protein n=1 Tax=unclassified Spirosoma TaxID=2621999 RepID=UPI0009669085|nr:MULTISPECIES: CBS domain-containing protein [unclassified Spirosoma]MBN8821015.1 CBS domain-containing protein [Spirosoma sp.]OJW76018.1 MAG: CBS domain-containing protein [Spirosoma sp. 48-14]
MKHREPVSNIMTRTVFTVNLNDDLHQVIDLINHHKIRHVPVVDANEIVGMISKTDVNRLTFSSLFEGQEDADEAVLQILTIEQVMTHKPRTIPVSFTIREVAEVFAEEEFHALPVVDEENKLVGIVTTTDVINYLLDQY